MFDIVAPDQHQVPATIDAGRLDHRETRLPSAGAEDRKMAAHEPPHQISAHSEHSEREDEGDPELHRNRQVVEEFHRRAPFPPAMRPEPTAPSVWTSRSNTSTGE